MATYVGIDLSTQADKTGLAVLERGVGDDLRLLEVSTQHKLGLTDDTALVEWVYERGFARLGIDAPFGWPQDFIRFLNDGLLPADPDRLWLRETDRWVRDEIGCGAPLSVSSNYLARTAVRCTRLRHLLGATDPAGLETPVAEVYPRATLYVLGLTNKGYKRAADAAPRKGIVEGLRTHVSDLPDDLTHHELDAVVCALTVSRACIRPPEAMRPAASVEGWIWVPEARVSRSPRPPG